MIIPGVQKPHWRPCLAQNASCSGWSAPFLASPSMVVTVLPSAWTARTVQDFTALPSRWIVQAPHWDVSQPTFVPVRPRWSRISSASSVRGSTCTSRRTPLISSATVSTGVSFRRSPRRYDFAAGIASRSARGGSGGARDGGLRALAGRLDDLGADRDRDLVRAAGPDPKPDRGSYARQLVVGHALGSEPFVP